MLDLRKAREYNDEAKAKFLLIGDSGGGKTHCASTAGTKKMPVAILETEPNGILSIRTANPDALVVEARDVATIQQFVVSAQNGTLKEKYGVEVVVFDSLTEIQQMLKEEVMGNSPIMSKQQWGILLERSRKLFRAIRDIPLHVICTALAKTDYTDSGERFVEPALEGSIRREAPQYFNAVGYCYKAVELVEGTQNGQSTKQVVHRVMFSGPSTYLCKGLAPLEAVEKPNANDWILRCVKNFGSAKPMKVAADPKRPRR